MKNKGLDKERIKEDIYYLDIIRDFVSVGENKIIVKEEEKSR